MCSACSSHREALAEWVLQSRYVAWVAFDQVLANSCPKSAGFIPASGSSVLSLCHVHDLSAAQVHPVALEFNVETESELQSAIKAKDG